MNEIKRKAYAKINLTLDVLKKRPDGYHDLRMVMQSVGVYDVVTCKKTDDGSIRFKTDSGFLSDEDSKTNLCVKAAKLLQEKYGCGGVEISLEKNIPIAAGLAGGSTDGAAVLKAVNTLYELKISQDELERLGVTLGADVPYTLRGGTVLCEGIGDIMTNLPAAPDCVLLLAKPGIYVSTGEVYKTLVLDETSVHPKVDEQIDAIKEGNLDKMSKLCDNILARVTEKKHPVIVEIEELMKKDGAINSIMSGSGPTVFGIFENEDDARKAAFEIEEKGLSKEVFVTEFIRDIEKF